MKILFTFLCVLMLSGCSNIDTVHKAIATDAVTTFAMLQDPHLEEKNPLLPNDPLGAALGVIIGSYAMIHAAKAWAPSMCKSTTKYIYGVTTGSTINNVLVMNRQFKEAPVMGITTAVAGTYFFGEAAANSFCK